MAMKRKRNGDNSFVFGNKRRRRFTARRRVRRGRTGSRFNSAQDGRPVSVRFRSRKLRPRAYRSALWKDTLFKAHYRSILDRISTVTMPTTSTTSRFGISPVHGDVAFWTIPGGLQPINVGANIPTFSDDIVVRGGFGSITFTNVDANDSIRVKLYLVRTGPNPDLATLPADQSEIALSASLIDPTVIPDFQLFGRVVKNFDILLLPGQRPVTFFQRIPIQKLDQVVFQANGGNRYWWLYFSSQTSNIDSVNNTLRIQFGHNLSFSADVVGETAPPELNNVQRNSRIPVTSLLTNRTGG